ncbi:MAG TPA: homoserine O-acetyltransferase [Xanthomonadaceae bacterium]|jgi:homoserine O-acetyltransferase|nr:homoserine O-acetyltransferase [Xanthomonadaceae bacterium]
MTEFIPPGTRWFDLSTPFAMKRGGALHGARLAFETWGTLSAQRDNAILILTGLSPSAHAAASEGNTDAGWWEAMLGPGKPIDTDRWFVICANSLGGCKGSTGAASIDPATGMEYRLAFPELSIEDIANSANELVRGLGIETLACVIGCSMGGMSALAYLALHPRCARATINISGAVQSLPFSIAIRSLQREAIRLDPKWNEGAYTDASYPENGMRMARKLGVITYRSSLEWSGRFGRVRLDSEQREGDDPFGLEFQVESYLEGHARRFVRQFDPNCYLYLSRSMDWFDFAEYGDGDANAALRAIASGRAGLQRALVIGVETDILFPLQQQEQIADGLRAGGAETTFAPLPSPQGHDAFLVDIARFGPVVGGFLGRL